MPADKRQAVTARRARAATSDSLLGRAVPARRTDEFHRVRLMRALATVAWEGERKPTVAAIVERAGTSPRTFYQWFSDVEDCAIASFDDGVQRATVAALSSGLPERWPARVRVVISSLLEFFEEEPAIAHLCLVASLRGGERMLQRRACILEQLTRWVDLGRSYAAPGREIPALNAEAAVAGAAGVLHDRLRRSRSPRLRELAGDLTAIVLAPYLGPAAARRERERVDAAGRRRVAETPAVSHPAASPIRLTYRTVRVLLAVGDQPGASNRQIAQAAGVVDQGQMSKLLARLAERGVVRNDGGPSGNSWELTESGALIVSSLRRAHP